MDIVTLAAHACRAMRRGMPQAVAGENPFICRRCAVYPVHRTLRWLVAVAAMCMLSHVCAAGIYKWTDENGQVHFGDRPPDRGARQVHIPKGNVIRPIGTPSDRKTRGDPLRHSTRKAKAARSRDRDGQCSGRVVYKTHLEKLPDKSAQWARKAVEHCRANHGVDCEDPAYVNIWRPKTAAQWNRQRAHWHHVVHAPDWKRRREDKIRWMKLRGYKVAKDTGDRIVFCR